MSLAESLVELAQQSGAKDLPVCEKAVADASIEQRSMVNALLETGQVDEKIFAHKLGESLGLPVWEGEIPPIPAPLREKFPALGSQMVCNAIYAVSRTSRMVFQTPASPFNLTKLVGKPLPLLQFSESCPVYFDRHTLSIKGSKLSLFTLDGRMHFELTLPDN
jgi:hypothetical protein